MNNNSIKEAGYEIDEMKIRLVVKNGYYFHEKAFFLIENGQLRFYQLEKPLSKEKIEKLEENIESIKDFEEVRSGQPVGISNGIAFDDQFLFFVSNENVEMYLLRKIEED